MSGREYEDEYEDELDRMRAQRKKRGGDRNRNSVSAGTVRQSGTARPYGAAQQYGSVRQERQRFTEADDDFEIEYLEDDEPKREIVRKRPPAERPYHSGRKKALKKRKKKKKVFFILLIAIILAGAFLFVNRWLKDRDGYWNIAVFGVDSRDGNLGKGALADVQMIASINRRTGEIRLVSVYRDTYVQIDDEGTFHKINEAYFKGGYQQALDTFQRNLDIQVDDYATFNWKAVADAINILGGIDLEITDREFEYINSFITATVESTGIYSTHLESAGMNHLDGVQAVAYSRLRLMDTDFNRTERQRKVVSLALEKAKQADLSTLTTLVATVLPEISTSIGAEDILPLAQNVSRYYLGQTGGFPFARTTARISGMDCVIPATLESNTILLHQFLFDDTSYQPSASVQEISQKISEISGVYEEGTASGADSNLTGSSGGSSGGSSAPAASGGSQTAAPAETEALPLPEESETTAESASEEETAEEESTEETSEGAEEENPDEEETERENGSESTRPVPVEPLAPEESTLSEEEIRQGPGAAQPSAESGNVTQTGPTEGAEEEYGPGFVQP